MLQKTPGHEVFHKKYSLNAAQLVPQCAETKALARRDVIIIKLLIFYKFATY